jgi:hypothetical protein
MSTLPLAPLAKALLTEFKIKLLNICEIAPTLTLTDNIESHSTLIVIWVLFNVGLNDKIISSVY